MASRRMILGLLILGLALFQMMDVLSAEHPEHPTEKPAGETEATKGFNKEELAKSVADYVKKDAKLKGGYFLVYDKKNKEALVLELVLVHKDRLSKIAKNIYFACADFKTLKGKIYDLDIFMKGTEKDNLMVTEVSVHKEAGDPRYTWYEENGIWKKKLSEEKAKEVADKGAEHPSEHPE